jgi:hypothetical protein
MTLTNLRPKWSIIQPAIGEIRSGGSEASATTMPAKSGESDFSRMSHGIEIVTIAFPRPEARFAVCKRSAGRMRREGFTA